MEPISALSRIREVIIRYRTDQTLPAGTAVQNSLDVYRLLGKPLMAERVEVFRCVLLDSKNRIMCYEDISRGSLSTSVVHPREVFSTPVRLQAAAVLFLHNHPSGDPTPSREDRLCTERLHEAGKILGIKVLDHIVAGDSDYFSFADSGLCAA